MQYAQPTTKDLAQVNTVEHYQLVIKLTGPIYQDLQLLLCFMIVACNLYDLTKSHTSRISLLA